MSKYAGLRRLRAIKLSNLTVTGEPCKTPFKRAYVCIKDAKRAIKKGPKSPLKPYKCECGMYHLTTVEKRS